MIGGHGNHDFMAKRDNFMAESDILAVAAAFVAGLGYLAGAKP
jgi:hypothetical protein